MFKFIDYLTKEKKKWKNLTEEEKNEYSPFVINSFLSNSEELVEIINFLNIYYKIPKKEHYNFLLKTLPKKKMFIGFSKKEKKIDKVETNSKSIQFIKKKKK